MSGIITGIVEFLLGILFWLLIKGLTLIFSTIDWGFGFHTGSGGLADQFSAGVSLITAGIPKGLKLVDFFVDVATIRLAFSSLVIWLGFCLAARIIVWGALKFHGSNP